MLSVNMEANSSTDDIDVQREITPPVNPLPQTLYLAMHTSYIRMQDPLYSYPTLQSDLDNCYLMNC